MISFHSRYRPITVFRPPLPFLGQRYTPLLIVTLPLPYLYWPSLTVTDRSYCMVFAWKCSSYFYIDFILKIKTYLVKIKKYSLKLTSELMPIINFWHWILKNNLISNKLFKIRLFRGKIVKINLKILSYLLSNVDGRSVKIRNDQGRPVMVRYGQ